MYFITKSFKWIVISLRVCEGIDKTYSMYICKHLTRITKNCLKICTKFLVFGGCSCNVNIQGDISYLKVQCHEIFDHFFYLKDSRIFSLL